LVKTESEYKELKNVNAGTMDLEIVEENGHTFARLKAMIDRP
jgi:hypothetical protein